MPFGGLLFAPHRQYPGFLRGSHGTEHECRHGDIGNPVAGVDTSRPSNEPLPLGGVHCRERRAVLLGVLLRCEYVAPRRSAEVASSQVDLDLGLLQRLSTQHSDGATWQGRADRLRAERFLDHRQLPSKRVAHPPSGLGGVGLAAGLVGVEVLALHCLVH